MPIYLPQGKVWQASEIFTLRFFSEIFTLRFFDEVLKQSMAQPLFRHPQLQAAIQTCVDQLNGKLDLTYLQLNDLKSLEYFTRQVLRDVQRQAPIYDLGQSGRIVAQPAKPYPLPLRYIEQLEQLQRLLLQLIGLPPPKPLPESYPKQPVVYLPDNKVWTASRQIRADFLNHYQSYLQKIPTLKDGLTFDPADKESPLDLQEQSPTVLLGFYQLLQLLLSETLPHKEKWSEAYRYLYHRKVGALAGMVAQLTGLPIPDIPHQNRTDALVHFDEEQFDQVTTKWQIYKVWSQHILINQFHSYIWSVDRTVVSVDHWLRYEALIEAEGLDLFSDTPDILDFIMSYHFPKTGIGRIVIGEEPDYMETILKELQAGRYPHWQKHNITSPQINRAKNEVRCWVWGTDLERIDQLEEWQVTRDEVGIHYRFWIRETTLD